MLKVMAGYELHLSARPSERTIDLAEMLVVREERQHSPEEKRRKVKISEEGWLRN